MSDTPIAGYTMLGVFVTALAFAIALIFYMVLVNIPYVIPGIIISIIIVAALTALGWVVDEIFL